MSGHDWQRHITGEIAEVKAAVKLIDQAIRGNGKPGIYVRIERIETKMALLWAAISAVVIGAAVKLLA